MNDDRLDNVLYILDKINKYIYIGEPPRPLSSWERALQAQHRKQRAYEAEKKRERNQLINQKISEVKVDSNNFIRIVRDYYRNNHFFSVNEIKRIALEAFKLNGLLLKVVADIFGDDWDAVLTAVKQNPDALMFAGFGMRDNEDVILFGIKENPELIIHASERIKKDKKIIMRYIKANSNLFKVLVFSKDEVLKAYGDDREVVFIAVKENGKNLIYVQRYFHDREIVLESLSQESGKYCIPFLLSLYNDDEEVMLAICRFNKIFIARASERLRSKRSFIETVFSDRKEDFFNRIHYSYGDLHDDYLMDFFPGFKEYHHRKQMERRELNSDDVSNNNFEPNERKKC